jgi:hypothetical protein
MHIARELLYCPLGNLKIKPSRSFALFYFVHIYLVAGSDDPTPAGLVGIGAACSRLIINSSIYTEPNLAQASKQART